MPETKAYANILILTQPPIHSVVNFVHFIAKMSSIYDRRFRIKENKTKMVQNSDCSLYLGCEVTEKEKILRVCQSISKGN